MSGPWEDYAAQDDGPWNDYAKPAMAEVPEQPRPPQRPIGQEVVRQGKLTLAAALKGLGALPMAAADFGIGARNLLTGEREPSPSDQWNQGIDQMLGKPEAPLEKVAQFVGSSIAGAAVPAPQGMGTIKDAITLGGKPAALAPSGFDPRSMRLDALKKAQDAGYVLPPSTTNPTATNKILESIGGKVATAQDASVRNQIATDSLVKADLGLSKMADVGEGTLAAIRKESAEAYKPLREIGTMRLDSKFGKDIDSAIEQISKVGEKFPKLAKDDLTGVIKSLKEQPSVDSDTAVETVSLLRANADEAYAAGQKNAGKIYKKAATAFEDAIERSLERRGESAKEALSKYRAARQLIAKTYSAQKALNPELGNFDARKLGQQLAAEKPLSGGMKKAGQAALAFRDATKLVTDSGSVRNTDVILGGGSAALSGEPMFLLYPFLRQAVRAGLLSPSGQKYLATPGKIGLPSELVMGGTAGLLGQ